MKTRRENPTAKTRPTRPIAPVPHALREPLPPQPKVAETILQNLSDSEGSPLIAARNRLDVLQRLFALTAETSGEPFDFALCAAIEDVQATVGDIERQIAEAHAALSGYPLLDTPAADAMLKGGRP